MWDDLKNIKVGLPPKEEQTQIAHFLDHETAKIDAMIREQERLIELLDEKRHAVISHAVTKGLDPDVPMKDSGVEWLGEVPAHWEGKIIKNRLLNQAGRFRNAKVTGKETINAIYCRWEMLTLDILITANENRRIFPKRSGDVMA